MEFPAPTPRSPYYAVIFTSRRTTNDTRAHARVGREKKKATHRTQLIISRRSVRRVVACVADCGAGSSTAGLTLKTIEMRVLFVPSCEP